MHQTAILSAKPQYLTIQKLVKLLSNYHRKAFEKFLRETRANIPAKLIESISSDLFEVESPDELCTAVYGKADTQTRKSFNQLASHTFRLTVYLSRNYPSYLWHNMQKVEQYLAEGELHKANLLADLLLDIAEKIGDFSLQISICHFLSQQAHLHKSQGETIRYLKLAAEAASNQQKIIETYLYLRNHFNISLKDDSVLKSLDEHLAYFRRQFEHPCDSLRIIHKFGYFFLLYYYRPSEYTTEVIQKELDEFINDQAKHGVIVFPLLEDIFSKATLYKLNFSTTDLSSREGRNEYQKLLTHSKFLHFWQNYVNKPELYAIAIKSTYYLSRYHSISHRNNFQEIIHSEDKQDIARLVQRCEELLNQDIWEPDHVNDLIHLKLTYSALLLMGDNEQQLQCIAILEQLMISYQQITFSESMDSIFICLMIGYFGTHQFERCVETYKRYIKLSKGRVVNQENHLEIHTYYYIAQWLLNSRNQYLQKISENYRKASQMPVSSLVQRTILELVNYFKIPVSLG